jgi:hypothetical protein
MTAQWSPEIDTTLFSRERDADFLATLVTTAEAYVHVRNQVTRGERLRSSGELEAIKDEFADFFGDTLADSFLEGTLSVGSVRVEKIDGDDADEPGSEDLTQRLDTVAGVLIGYTIGYQEHLAEKLESVFDGDKAEAAASAWTATWEKLRTALTTGNYVLRLDVIGFFDALVQFAYPTTYNERSITRGPEAKANIATRTFYEVMKDHVSRNILGRASGDSWS